MYDSRTQFDLTERGVERLETLRETDLVSAERSIKLDYSLLTMLDQDGMKDFQGIMDESPRSATTASVDSSLASMVRGGWVEVVQ